MQVIHEQSECLQSAFVVVKSDQTGLQRVCRWGRIQAQRTGTTYLAVLNPLAPRSRGGISNDLDVIVNPRHAVGCDTTEQKKKKKQVVRETVREYMRMCHYI